jgi:hypothetical protein
LKLPPPPCAVPLVQATMVISWNFYLQISTMKKDIAFNVLWFNVVKLLHKTFEFGGQVFTCPESNGSNLQVEALKTTANTPNFAGVTRTTTLRFSIPQSMLMKTIKPNIQSSFKYDKCFIISYRPMIAGCHLRI